MNEKNSRLNILAAVSDWLKLLALTVLVAESVILIAMQITPQSNPIAPWYPLFMLIFLIVVVVGVFVDRRSLRKAPEELTLGGGEHKISVDTSKLTIPSKELAQARKVDLDAMFIDSQRGFMFNRPKLPLWSDPQYLGFGGMAARFGLGSKEEWEKMKKFLSVNPLLQMLGEASCLLLTCGEPIDVRLTDETSNTIVDNAVKNIVSLAEKEGKPADKESIRNLRRSLVRGYSSQTGPLEQMKLQNHFMVAVLDKSLAFNSPIEPNLGTFFLTYTSSVGPYVENLVANEKSILWGFSTFLTNVLIDGELRELRTYQRNLLTESDRSMFLVTIWFSPQTSSSLDIWPELQDMVASFKVIS